MSKIGNGKMLKTFCDACKTKDITDLSYYTIALRDNKRNNAPRMYEICDECSNELIFKVIGEGRSLEVR